MSKDKSSIKQELYILRDTIAMIHSIDKKYLPVVILKSLFDTAKFFLALVMSRYILDELIVGKSVDKLILYVGIIIGGSLVLKLLSDLMDRIKNIGIKGIQQNIYCRMSEKILSLDYEYIDNPEVHNLRQKVLEYDRMNGIAYNLTDKISQFVTGVIQIITSLSISAALLHQRL